MTDHDAWILPEEIEHRLRQFDSQFGPTATQRFREAITALAHPAPAATGEEVHVRHVGGGLLALYRGDEQVREIGPTPGWNFRDRDEFIVRYNATTPAQQGGAVTEAMYRGMRNRLTSELMRRFAEQPYEVARTEAEAITIEFEDALAAAINPGRERATTKDTPNGN